MSRAEYEQIKAAALAADQRGDTGSALELWL